MIMNQYYQKIQIGWMIMKYIRYIMKRLVYFIQNFEFKFFLQMVHQEGDQLLNYDSDGGMFSDSSMKAYAVDADENDVS